MPDKGFSSRHYVPESDSGSTTPSGGSAPSMWDTGGGSSPAGTSTAPSAPSAPSMWDTGGGSSSSGPSGPSPSMWNTGVQQLIEPEPEVPADDPSPFGDALQVDGPGEGEGNIVQGPVLTEEERLEAHEREGQEALETWMTNTESAIERLNDNPSESALERTQWLDVAKYMVIISHTEDVNEDIPQDLTDWISDYNNQLMSDYGDNIKDHLENTEEGWWDRNYVEPESRNLLQSAWDRNKDDLGHIVSRPIISHVLKALDWSSQQTLAGLDEKRVEGNRINYDLMLRAMEKAVQEGDDARIAELRPAIEEMVDDPHYLTPADPGEDGRLNFREAYMGKDKDWGGWIGTLIDVVGTAIYDPTSYVGIGPLGRAAAAKVSIRLGASMEGAAEAGLLLNRRIGAVGVKKLTSIETENMLRWHNLGVGEVTGALKRSPEARAASQLMHLERSGQSGIRMAGRTVIPTNPQAYSPRFGAKIEGFFRSTPVSTTTARRTEQLVQQEADSAAAASTIAAADEAAVVAKEAATSAENLLAARMDAILVDPTDLKTTATGLPMPEAAAGKRFGRTSVADDVARETEEAYTAARNLNTSTAEAAADAESSAAAFAAARSSAAPNNPVLFDPATKIPGYNKTTANTKRLSRSAITERRVAQETLEAYTEANKANALKVLGAADDDVVNALNIMDEALGKVDVLVRADVKNGMLNFLKDNKGVNAVRRKIVPRERLVNPALRSDDLGPIVLSSAVAKSKGLRSMRLEDALAGLTESAVKAATKEWTDWEALNHFLNQAMSSRTKYDDAIASLTAQGASKADTLRLLEDLGQADDLIRASNLRAGVDVSHLRESRNYIPRILDGDLKENIKTFMALPGDNATREAKARAFAAFDIKVERGKSSAWEVVDEFEGSRDVFDMTAERGARLKRTLDASIQDLYDVNDAQRNIFKNADDGVHPLADFSDDMFNTDVVAAVAFRAHSAFQAEMFMDLVDYIGDFSDDMGRKFAYVARDPKDVRAVMARMKEDGIVNNTGYAVNDLEGGGKVFMHEGMYEELNDTRIFMESSADMNAFQKNLRSANSVWAASATVVMPTNMPHHLRNAQGNVFLATLGGLDNPDMYRQAAAIQRLQKKIRGRVDEVGGTWDDAAKYLDDVSPEDAEIMELIRTWDITGTSMMQDQVGLTGAEGGVARAILTSWPVTSGRAVAETLENNGRIALFMDGLNKGMSAERSAANVRKFMIDYSDLTKFESGAARVGMRFYTFMRKNLAIQASSLVRFPGRVVNAQRVMEAGVDLFMGTEVPTPADMVLPEWYAEKNVKLRSEGIFGALTGAEYVSAGVDTPLVAAAGSLNGMGALPASLPVVRDFMPSWLTYGEREETYGRFLGLFNGVVPGVLDLFYGERFGRDPFTGGPLEGGTLPDLMRVFNTFSPLVSRVDSLQSKWQNEDSELGRWLLLANQVSGLTNFDLTDDRQEGARAHISTQIEQTIRDLEREYPGLDIPSISELQSTGILALESAVVQALWYTDPDDVDSGLLASLTKQERDGLRDLGLFVPEPEDMPTTQGELAIQTQNRLDAQAALRVLHQLPEMTELEERNTRLSSPGIPTQDWFLRQGIEPASTANRHTQRQEQDKDAEYLRNFNAVMGYNITLDELAELQPLLTDMDRAVQEAIDDELTEEEFDDWLINDYLTRTEKANLPAPFGVEPGELFSLDLFRDGSLSDEDLDEFRVRSWEQRAVIDFYYKRYIGRAPTWVESTTWVYQTLLSKGDQRYAGLKPGVVVPQRTNIQSEAQERADAMKLIDIVNETSLPNGTSGAPLTGGSSGGSMWNTSNPTPFADRSPGG